ncbi:MAG: RNA methyltransferase [Clostridia bacterium]|nr:RNA methyltransferase [Clostridia bacterium]
MESNIKRIKKEEEKFVSSDRLEGMSSISALIKAIEANTNPRRIIKILFDQAKCNSKRAELGFLRAKAKQLDFEIEMVSAEVLQKISIGSTHGGIIAECTSRELPSLTDAKIKKDGVYFLLDGVEDPYNFGYAVRSLYAAGVDGVIVPPRNWMGAAGVVARSSAGASELMEMYVCEPTDSVTFFKERGYSVVCAGIRDSVSLYDTDLSKPLFVILGGEKRGISRALLEQADRIIRIDYGSNFGGSLSTSAAAAIFAFEILRVNR